MKRLQEVLAGQQKNYMLPFLWMHGEDEAALRREIEKIDECGIKALCMESRPHPDFCGPDWWRDVDIVMDEARRRGMRVWLLDDRKFPTGYANGWFQNRCPQKAKLYLAEKHMDLLGPAENTAVLVRPALPADAALVGIYAYPLKNRQGTELDGPAALELTGALGEDGFVRLNVPAGQWRLFVLYTTRTGGGRPHYMNLVDEASVRVLLDAVYEPHYTRYKADFGKTFAGFFSDEAELGNSPGYDFHETLGRADTVLPWSEALHAALGKAWGADFAVRLAALWYECGPDTAAIRYAYMDELTRLVRSCFSQQLGGWCERHGIEYIGHIIEDDNAHARLGCSVGHYFRYQAGQHMGGVDVVHYQILPGFTETTHRWIDWEGDGEFFHFGLAKLGSSAGHLDANKKGRSVCELFGNYGWAEGIATMKWLADHMLVRGINHFVPHAFSPTFPDLDCPPHFFAGGNNAQFELFGQLARYMNRAAHLLSGGDYLVHAAVLYHAEAEWAGSAMLFQKPVRALLEAQFDCDVICADKLAEGLVQTGEKALKINGRSYPCLIVPECDALPPKAAVALLQAARAGVCVLFAGHRPRRCCEGGALPSGFESIGTQTTLEQLAKHTEQAAGKDILVQGNLPALRLCAVRQPEGRVCMFFNESPFETVETQVRVAAPGFAAVGFYDGVSNACEEFDLENGAFPLRLAPGESQIVILKKAACGAELPRRSSQALQIRWAVQALEMATQNCVKTLTLEPGEAMPNMNAPQCLPGFTGTFVYTGVFCARALPKARLYLPKACDGAQVWVNEEYAGAVLGASGRVEVGRLLRDGENQLRIAVPNTLVWRMKDENSFYMQLGPTGLGAPPILEYT